MRDLLKDKEICNAATPGPYENKAYGREYKDIFAVNGGLTVATAYDPKSYNLMTEQALNNARFITEAREGWPHAIDRALTAEAERDGLRRELDAARAIEFNARKKYNLSPDVAFTDLAKFLHEARAECDRLRQELELRQVSLNSMHAKTERLWQWARENLTGDEADQFWQIVANGSLMHENPEYQQRIHILQHENNGLRAELTTCNQAVVAALAKISAVRELLKHIKDGPFPHEDWSGMIDEVLTALDGDPDAT